VLVYRTTLDLTSLSDNVNITVNARVYPWIGGNGSVLDSADQSALREFSPRVYRKNTARTSAPYIVRVKSGGNDSSGAVSTNAATTEASPCATLTGAINRANVVLGTGTGALDGLRIQLDAGTWSRGDWPAFFNTVNAEIVIEPKPGVARASCVFQFGASNNGFEMSVFRMRGITVRRTGPFANKAPQSTYEDCVIDYHGNTDTPFAVNGGNCMFFEGCNFGTAGVAIGHVNSFHALHRGCVGGSANSADQREHYVVVGCDWTGGRHEGVSGRSQQGSVIAFNKFMKNGSAGGGGLLFTGSGTLAGAAIVQNLVEWNSSGVQLDLRISADGDEHQSRHPLAQHACRCQRGRAQ